MKSMLADIFEVSHNKHSKIRSMEGLRGFAVFLVFLVHFATLSEPYLEENSFTFLLADTLHTIGHAGVDLFFVLSGYLIYGMLLRKRQPFFSYLQRRIQRIYPVFIVVFVIYLALSFIFPAESKLPPETSDAVVFVIQNFLLLPGVFDIKAIITVAWSLSYEFFFYLITPLVLFVLRLRDWPYTNRLWFLLVVAVIGFSLAISAGSFVRMLMFVSGMMLYEVTSHTELKPFRYAGFISILTAIVIMAVFPHFEISGGFKYIALFILFFVLCWECFTSRGPVQALFSIDWLRWFGNMSYSYYLIHGLALKALFMVVGIGFGGQTAEWIFWVFLIPAFFITLIPSTLLFMYVEKPWSLNAR